MLLLFFANSECNQWTTPPCFQLLPFWIYYKSNPLEKKPLLFHFLHLQGLSLVILAAFLWRKYTSYANVMECDTNIIQNQQVLQVMYFYSTSTMYYVPKIVLSNIFWLFLLLHAFNLHKKANDLALFEW